MKKKKNSYTSFLKLCRKLSRNLFQAANFMLKTLTAFLYFIPSLFSRILSRYLQLSQQLLVNFLESPRIQSSSEAKNLGTDLEAVCSTPAMSVTR